MSRAKGSDMPLSVFNHYVEDFPETGDTLVHNTFTGAYVVLDSRVIDALRKVDRGEAVDEEELEWAADEELLDPDVGVLVESLQAEEKEFLAWFEKRRDRRQLDCIVGINLACNFACTYCCQADVMDGTVMTRAHASQTGAWLAHRANTAGVQSVFLSFLGGEPLLHPDRIELVVAALKQDLKPGVEVSFGLTTNGYFLDAAMLERLVSLGLTSTQITIDGDRSTHCTTRVSKKGEDTYDRIFAHAIAASRRIRVRINGNYTENTVSAFPPLLKNLSDAGLPEKSVVSFTPAYDAFGVPEGAGCKWSSSDTDVRVALHDATFAYGFRPLPLGVVGPCSLHDLHSYTIEPTGNIYKCPGFLGHSEWAIGHVTDGVDEDGYRHILGQTPKRDHCGGCSHRPRCGGGCLAAEWIRSGNTHDVNCEKGYFDETASPAAIRGYLLASAEDVEAAVTQFPRQPTPRARGVRPASLMVLA